MADAVQKGYKEVTIRTVDTDVVVLAVAMFRKIKPGEMWIALGSGTNLRYIGVHQVPVMLSHCSTHSQGVPPFRPMFGAKPWNLTLSCQALLIGPG